MRKPYSSEFVSNVRKILSSCGSLFEGSRRDKTIEGIYASNDTKRNVYNFGLIQTVSQFVKNLPTAECVFLPIAKSFPWRAKGKIIFASIKLKTKSKPYFI